MAGTEMHFQVRPPGEISRTLVPDVAFISLSNVPADYIWQAEPTFFLLDTSHKTVTAIDRARKRTFGNNETLEHGSLPGFALRVASLFELP